ncbi:hypothetical protein GBAR_LOCUS28401, partial [Geodia barretti]
ICGRSPQQPLATWSERLKRWSSGNRTTKKQTGDTATESETSSSSGGEAQEVKSEVSQSTTKQETAEDDIEVLLQEKDEKIKQLQDKYLRALARWRTFGSAPGSRWKMPSCTGFRGFPKTFSRLQMFYRRPPSVSLRVHSKGRTIPTLCPSMTESS